MPRYLALWLPNWPVQRVVSKQPDLAPRPLVLEQVTHRGHFVARCSPAARGRGIELGMPLAEARSLARGAGLEVLPYDPHADRKALEKLAQWLHRFSPTVGVDEGDEAETLLLDATNLAPLFGGERSLAEQLSRGIARLGLEGRVAVADTIGTAWGVAHWGAEALNVVPEQQGRAALAPLSLRGLRLPAGVEEKLAGLGIRTVGEVLALPRDELEARFEGQLLRRIDQALGAIPETIAPVAPPQEFTAEWLLEHPLTNLKQIEKLVGLLVQQVAQQLAARQAGALELVCRFTCPPARSVTLQAGLFRPTSGAEHLLEVFGMHLERLLLPAPVTGVRLWVARHAPVVERQQTLFEPERTLDESSPLASLVDRLAGRLGREAVVECRLQSDAQPELAYREEPLIGRGVAKRRTSTKASPPGILDRPLHLLPRAVRLQVVAVAPEGPPVRFHTPGHEHLVARYWGPERIESGWWRKRGVRRDYYRVETDQGRRFWLFRRLDDGTWFLHGTYE